jgi:Phycobilisome protein
MSRPTLSPAVLELIPKARIVSLATWQDSYTPELLQIFQAADDQRLYLSDVELQQIPHSNPDQAKMIAVVTMLREQVVDIVNEARSVVLTAFPQILEPGGGLYPAERADACWRDFWQFLRCITYGIAGQRPDYLSAEGLHYMNLLYQELQVPLDAMVVGLQGIKSAALRRLDQEEQELLAVYFDRLIQAMSQFQPVK